MWDGLSPNKLDDVELVRFGYFCLGRNPKVAAPPDLASLISSMRASGAYGDDLQVVIDAHEGRRGGTQDGTVSVERPGVSGELYDGQHSFIMAILNNHMIDFLGDGFPRIDLDDASGPEISKTARLLLNVDL